MRKIIVLIVFILSLQAEESSYELGKGMQIASLPLYIGGYFSSDFRNMNNENRYTFDDIAVMGYGNYNKFSYMAEFEYKSFYVETHRADTTTITRDTKIHTERIYLDYKVDESYMFRAGKYNNPIGFWNLLPVNVLRDTTSSPASLDMIFPKFTTGAMASYSSFNEGELKIDLMFQNNSDLDRDYNNYIVDKHYGFNISYEKDDYTLKVNGGYFRNVMAYHPSEPDEPYESLIHPEELYYFLLSGRYDTEKYQFLSEIGAQRKENEFTTNYAGYLQGLYRFSEQHIGVLRLESYDDKLHEKSDDIAVIAYTYRPIYPVAIKSEYQFHSISQENQFLFSLSVLF